jgi:transcriptional regulator GlxA family with amidase domain
MSLVPPTRHGAWRSVFRVVTCVLAFLLVPLVVGFANFGSKLAAATPPAGHLAYSGPIHAPTYDPSKRIAVFVSGSEGAEITDTLPNFEILARSGAFNVYIVAPERNVVPFNNSGPSGDSGLDFIPSFSFAEYDATIGKDPDVIAIPAQSGSRDAVLGWIRAHTGPQTTLLGICVGSAVLADTGLLDGHAATQNTQRFDGVAASHPAIRLVRDVRYVDDGPVVTSTSVAAGIDATLHVVARLVGRQTADDVARQLGYTHTGYLDDTRFVWPTMSEWFIPVGVNAAFEWPQEKRGVLLSDGVSEFALAASLDAPTASLAATAKLFAPERAPIVSRDGLVLLPRYDYGRVPALDRVVVPGGDATSARQQAIATWNQLHPDRPVDEIHRDVGPGGSAFDLTIRDLARRHNGMVAAAIAEANYIPTGPLSDAAWPIEPIAAPLLLGLLGVGLVLAVGQVQLRRPASARSYALSHGQAS